MTGFGTGMSIISFGFWVCLGSSLNKMLPLEGCGIILD